MIDPIHFQELSRQDLADGCRRALCAYDDAQGVYVLPVWDKIYTVDPHQSQVVCVKGNHEDLHPYLELFMVHYLLTAREIEPVHQWISEKDLPGGVTFFRGPHQIPTGLISDRFQNDIQGFKNRCDNLGGIPLPLADAAFAFQLAPRIPVAVLYWKGDDEFPAESKILFDKTIGSHLASDIIFALAVGVCDRLGKL